MDTLPISRVTPSQNPPAQPASDVATESGGFDQTLQQQMQPQQPVKSGKGEARAEARTEAKSAAKSTENASAKTADSEDISAEITEENGETVVAVVQNLILAGAELPVTTAETVDTAVSGEMTTLAAEIAPELVLAGGMTTEQALPPGGKTLPQVTVNVPVMAAVHVGDKAAVTLQTTTLQTSVVTESVTDMSTAQAPLNVQLVEEMLPSGEIKLAMKSVDTAANEQFNAVLNNLGRVQAPSTQQVAATSQSSMMNLNLQGFSDAPINVLPGSTQPFAGNIHTPVNHPNWGQGVGDQLAFMVQGKLQSAEIKLNPAHLGPMEIRLSLNDDQASVTFVSSHAAVRDALDAAVPRLRDMLEQQGINLANVDVSAHSGGRQQAADDQASSSQPGKSVFGFEQRDETQPASVQRVVKIESGLSVYV